MYVVRGSKTQHPRMNNIILADNGTTLSTEINFTSKSIPIIVNMQDKAMGHMNDQNLDDLNKSQSLRVYFI